MMHLEYDHAQVRLAALELVEVLFARSASFRALLAPNLRDFMALTIGIDDTLLLPPPEYANLRVEL